ncbi:outer membrane protein [Geobacter sp. AOG2]|uniref:outer membrane protein n=1 Tax=Geobacter sp. AOG2 TaxID=1566347 RepID=UPI001CC7A70E|nr:outer membrane beta-barrel protein [Geobacter sp. AOG2]GFE61815.1 outer membrane channel protein [Geobacter sp. AOG2]
MRRTLTTLALLIAVAIPAVSQATPMRPGPYVTGFLGITVPKAANASGVDYTSTPATDFQERIEFDPGVYIGGTGGFDFGFLRLEGELSYKHAEISTITGSNGSQLTNPDGSLGALAFMGNAFVDLHNDSPVTPYLGGGIGFATLHLSDTYGGAQHGLLYSAADDTVFAYQVGAGMDFAINRRYSLDLGYRYFNTDKANFNGDWVTAHGIKFESHNVAVGFKVKF